MKNLIICMAIAACFFTACKSNSGSSSIENDCTATALKRNKQTALNTEMALSKGDVDGMFKDCTADYLDYGNGESKPEKMDTAKAGLKSFFAAFPNFKGKNLVAVADSNLVIVTGEWSGTFKNDYMSMKSNGKSFKAPEADIFTFNQDGKITSHRSIQSVAAYLYQLGLLVPVKK
jgi:predicted ester cyclase